MHLYKEGESWKKRWKTVFSKTAVQIIIKRLRENGTPKVLLWNENTQKRRKFANQSKKLGLEIWTYSYDTANPD